MFRHRQPRERHAQTRARRFIHLSETHATLWQPAALFHLMIEVIPLASSLAYSGKNRIPAVLGCNVMNEFLDDDSLADARASEETHLASLEYRADKIYNFNTSFQNFNFRRLFDVFWCVAVNWQFFIGRNRFAIINDFTEDVENASECSRADGHRNRRASICHFHSARQAVCRIHGYGPDNSATEELFYFKNNFFIIIHYR